MLRPVQTVRIHTIKNPGSNNSGTSLCPGEIHPLEIRTCSGRAPNLQILTSRIQRTVRSNQPFLQHFISPPKHVHAAAYCIQALFAWTCWCEQLASQWWGPPACGHEGSGVAIPSAPGGFGRARGGCEVDANNNSNARCIYVHTIYIYIYIYIYMRIYIYIWHVCIHMCMCIYIYMYIHTYI